MWAVWWAWTHATLRRLAREGVVLRALCGPALLLTCTLVGTGAVVSLAQNAAPVAVSEEILAHALREADIPSHQVADPMAELDAERTDRAVVQSPAGWHIYSRPSGWARWSGRRAREDLRVEAVVRAVAGAPWQLDVEPLPDLTPDLPRHVAAIARVLGVLYTLYAVILVTASAVRDREGGVLEALGATPVPGWIGPAARAAAVFAAVGGTLVATQVLVGALLGLSDLWALVGAGLSSVAAGVALGTVAPTGRGWRPRGPFTGAPGGLSAPLSQALVVAMGLGGIGFAHPRVGGFLPVGALSAGATEVLPLCIGGVVALGMVVGAIRRAGAARW